MDHTTTFLEPTFAASWLSDSGPESLDRVTDVNGVELLFTCYSSGFQRDRLIATARLEVPFKDVERAKKIGERLIKTGAPAIFVPVLNDLTDNLNIIDNNPVCAYGLYGSPGEHKSSLIAYLAYKTDSPILALDQFYPGYTAKEYLEWLNQEKPSNFEQAKEIIFTKLPAWLKQKKRGESTQDAPKAQTKPFEQVLQQGLKDFLAEDNRRPWLLVDLPGIPRDVGVLKLNRKYNVYDLAAASLEIGKDALPKTANFESWVEHERLFLQEKGLIEARRKREELIAKLTCPPSV